MRKDKLEAYIGKKVTVTFPDHWESQTGILYPTGHERFKNNPNLYLPRNYYVVIGPDGPGFLFRSSHVKTCKPVMGGVI